MSMEIKTFQLAPFSFSQPSCNEMSSNLAKLAILSDGIFVALLICTGVHAKLS